MNQAVIIAIAQGIQHLINDGTLKDAVEACKREIVGIPEANRQQNQTSSSTANSAKAEDVATVSSTACFCSKCGAMVQSSHKFCTMCGNSLA